MSLAGHAGTATPGVCASPEVPARWRPTIPETLAILLLVAATLAAAFGPELIGIDPLAQNLRFRNRPPSELHLLGTDHLGRDIAARLLGGLRMSLIVALLALVIALSAGALLAMLASVAGGPFAAAFFWLIDVLRAMPGVLLALVLVAAFGQGMTPLALAVGLTFAPTFALVTRFTLERETALPAVAAIRGLGATRMRIAFRHVVPHLAGPLVTLAAIVFPRCIVTESVMSFLGLGASPDSATWGRMIAQASRFFEINPTAVLAPTLALAVLTLALTLVGALARRRLDPLRRSATA
ncbi:MAG: ABC transporter permease [Beijerinckiaceae bacterium]